jgi:putative membrane protein
MVRFTGLFLLLALAAANAFTLQSPSKVQSTQLYGQTKQPPAIAAPVAVSYGEESRKYRRTVYTHDDWVKHRNPDRFVRNILSTTSSGVYKNVAREVWFTVGTASAVFAWNMVCGGYMDFEGVTHDPLIQHLPTLTLPLTPFTLASPSLGLLLGTFLRLFAFICMRKAPNLNYFLDFQSSEPTPPTNVGTKRVRTGV